MPLFIKDDTVDDLAARVKAMTGAATKTDAVRRALEAQIEAENTRVPLIERLRALQVKAERSGPSIPSSARRPSPMPCGKTADVC